MNSPLRTLVPIALAACLPISALRAGTFTENFDSGVPGGATVYGSAFVDAAGGFAGGGLKLTTNSNSLQGSFILDDLDAGGPVNSFDIQFKARIGGGSSPPADGWSFCFATDLPLGSWGEEGAGTGLQVCFDTYDNTDGNPFNGAGEAPAITVRWNGALVTEVFTTLDALTTGEGTPATPQWTDVAIKLDTDGSLDVTFDGVPHIANLFTPYEPISGGSFGFGARTGGLNANHFIDDLNIATTTGGLKAGIVHQPQSSIFLSGSPARFYVLLGNEAAATGYQWERRPPGGGAFAPIAGATSRDLVTPAVTPADSLATYRLAIADAAGTTYSDEATLTVDTLPEPVFPYSQDFAGGVIPVGSTTYGNAAGDAGGFLSLTPAANDQSGGFVVGDINAGAAISSIFVTFDLHMGEGGAPPADGFSFNWATDVPAGTVPGAEEGAGTGLRVCFDVYDNTDGNPLNGAGEGPTLDLKWGNTVLSSVRVSPFEFDTGTTFIHTAVSLAPTGLVSVAFNGRLYFKDVQVPAWTALSAAQYGFYARTGGANQKHEIDNLKIKTDLYAGPVQIIDEPEDFVGILGGTATFTAGANYAVPPAAVKWQKKAAGAGSFTDIPLATAPTYTTGALTVADNGALYQAIVSLSPTNTATTREALLTVVDFSAPAAADVVMNFEGDTSNTGTAGAAGDGTVVAGTAAGGGGVLAAAGGVGGGGYLALTDAVNDANGSLIIQNFSGASGQGALYASFYVHLTGGGVVNAVPADGFSFSWGADAPNTTIGGAEDGGGTGLIVTFDTYDNVDANPDNGTGEAPAIGIKYGGVYITPEKMVTRTTFQPLDWAQVGIKVDNDGTVDVLFDGVLHFYNVPIPGWTGLPNGRFNIAGRTGGANETHWIDSLVINTTNYVGPISFIQQPVNSAGFVGSTVTFTAQVNDPAQTTWQWESAPAGSPTFTPIGGATTNSYTTSALALADAGRQIRVKAQGLAPANLLTSNIAILSVEDPNLPLPSAVLDFDNPTTVTYTFLGSGVEADNGGIGDSRTGVLTTAAASLNGNLAILDINSGAAVTSMYASWQMRIGGGTTPPADGVAFCWSDDVTSSSVFGEEGAGNGLVVSFDTWDNGLPDRIGISLKYGGAMLAEQPLPYTAFLSDPDYYPTVVKVDADGTADVWYNNAIIFNNVALPGWAPVSGANWVWGARTGGANENAFLDNINLFTTAGAGATIAIQVVGANIVITYTGTLQSSTTMATGSWAPVPLATSPYQFALPTSGALFFRAGP